MMNASDDGDNSSGSTAGENYWVANLHTEFVAIYVALLEFRINYTPAAMKVEVGYKNDIRVKMF